MTMVLQLRHAENAAMLGQRTTRWRTNTSNHEMGASTSRPVASPSTVSPSTSPGARLLSPSAPHFPTLSLEQVNGAIAFYLAHRAEVDRTIEEENQLFEKLKAENPLPEKLRERLEQTRQRLAPPPK